MVPAGVHNITLGTSDNDVHNLYSSKPLSGYILHSEIKIIIRNTS